MKTIVLSIILLFASLAMGSASKASKKEFMSGDLPAKASAEDIQDNLTRNDYVNTGGPLNMATLKAEVIFISKPLIEAQETELGKKNMDGDDEVKKSIAKWSADLINNKTCFLIEIKTPDIETDKFTSWKAKLEQPEGKYTEVVFRNTRGVESVPKMGTSFGAGHQEWVNNSYSCADKVIDLSKPFSLHLIPQWGTSKKITLEWK